MMFYFITETNNRLAWLQRHNWKSSLKLFYMCSCCAILADIVSLPWFPYNLILLDLLSITFTQKSLQFFFSKVIDYFTVTDNIWKLMEEIKWYVEIDCYFINIYSRFFFKTFSKKLLSIREFSKEPFQNIK